VGGGASGTLYFWALASVLNKDSSIINARINPSINVAAMFGG